MVFAITFCWLFFFFCCCGGGGSGGGGFLHFHFNHLKVTPRVSVNFPLPLHISGSISMPDLCKRSSHASQHSFNRDILFCSSDSLGTIFPLSICLDGDVFLTGSLAGKLVFMCFYLRLHSLARTFQMQFGVSSWSMLFLLFLLVFLWTFVTTLVFLNVLNNNKHIYIV